MSVFCKLSQNFMQFCSFGTVSSLRQTYRRRLPEKGRSLLHPDNDYATHRKTIPPKKSIYGRYCFLKKHKIYISASGGDQMGTRKAVANRLLELCEEKKLSVNALARISAVPPSTVKNIINGGSKNAGIVTLKKLCDGLEISLFDFFNTETFQTLEQEIK